MNEKIQIDLEDLEDFTEYSDGNCEHLERILRETSAFEGCRVKRIRLQLEAPELKDPFDIQDNQGEHLAWLYIWEIEALSVEQIQVFARVQKDREKNSDRYLGTQIVAAVLSLMGLIFIIIQVVVPLIGPGILLPLPFYLISAIILTIGLVVLIVTQKRKKSRFAEIDLNAARESSEFIDALRELAHLYACKGKEMEDYQQRLEELDAQI